MNKITLYLFVNLLKDSEYILKYDDNELSIIDMKIYKSLTYKEVKNIIEEEQFKKHCELICGNVRTCIKYGIDNEGGETSSNEQK